MLWTNSGKHTQGEFDFGIIHITSIFIQQYINSGVETPYKELQC